MRPRPCPSPSVLPLVVSVAGPCCLVRWDDLSPRQRRCSCKSGWLIRLKLDFYCELVDISALVALLLPPSPWGVVFDAHVNGHHGYPVHHGYPGYPG